MVSMDGYYGWINLLAYIYTREQLKELGVKFRIAIAGNRLQRRHDYSLNGRQRELIRDVLETRRGEKKKSKTKPR